MDSVAPQDSTQQATPAKTWRGLSWAAFVVFSALVTVHLGLREFWTDETITFGHVASWATTDEAFHPRGYYGLLYIWKLFFGDSDVALRAFSIPWALAAFGLLTLIARRVLQPRERVLAQWLFALSPFVVLYFRMARFYAMTTALALLVAYCAVLVIQAGRYRHWLALALAGIALFQTNYLAAGMLAPLYLCLIWQAGRKRQLLRLALSLPPLGIVILLRAHTVTAAAADIGMIEGGVAAVQALHLPLRFALPLYSFALGENTEPWRFWLTVPAGLATLVAFGLGIWAIGERRPGYAVVALAYPVALAMGVLMVTFGAPAEPISAVARSLLFAAPLGYAALAVGAMSLRRAPVRIALIVVLLSANVYGLANYLTGRQALNPNHVIPWREIAGAIETRAQPDDIVVTYYDRSICRYGHFPHYVDGNEGAFEGKDRLEEWPRHGGRIWFVARDRGSAGARQLTEWALADLAARAGKVEKMDFMPYNETQRRWRERLLGARLPEFYVTVYVLSPPG